MHPTVKNRVTSLFVLLGVIAVLVCYAVVRVGTLPPALARTAPGQPGCSGSRITARMSPNVIQKAVDRAPSGSTFCFGEGTYDRLSIEPRENDQFYGGDGSAVLDGQHVQEFAFYSGINSSGNIHWRTANDVLISGFVIENYHTPLQNGAIESFGTTGWTIRHNRITHNEAAGVATGSDVRVVGNILDHNAQEGFAAHGANILYLGNTISYNNNPYDADTFLAAAGGGTWEAGGGKAWDTSNATFEDNTVSNNGGNGLWADTNNINTVFTGNTVTNNWGAGIYDEISYNPTITNNLVAYNGMRSAPGGGERLGYLFDAGIQLRGSGSLSGAHPSVVSGNIVLDNYNGISLLQSPDGSNGACNSGDRVTHGPCLVQNVWVEHNFVLMTQGASGAVQDGAGNAIFTSRNNRFVDNTYRVAQFSSPNDGYTYGWFAWNNTWPTWTQWQNFGNDRNGSLKWA